jgi:hypothetical protein
VGAPAAVWRRRRTTVYQIVLKDINLLSIECICVNEKHHAEKRAAHLRSLFKHNRIPLFVEIDYRRPQDKVTLDKVCLDDKVAAQDLPV